jgi:hypothetical protein
MSDRTKKILFAVVFILVSIGMGYLVYWMLFPAAKTPITAINQPDLTGSFPTSGAGTTSTTPITQPGVLPPSTSVPSVTTPQATPTAQNGTNLIRAGITQAVSPSADKNGARFYNPEDGRFYQTTKDGTITSLGDKQFFNVDKVSWANTKNNAIITTGDGSKLYYNFETKQQVTLPSHWDDFQFAPSDNQVVAKSLGSDENNRFLIVSNPDGTEAKAIQDLGNNADKVHVDWTPSSQVVAWTTTGDPVGGNQQQILFVGQHQENFNALIAPGQGFMPNWSPSGNRLLFSVWMPEDNNKPSLWLSAGDTANMGANRKKLGLATWANKCTWGDENEIICAVPQNLPANAGLMPSEFDQLPDDVYRVDLTTGSATKINNASQNYAVKSPVISGDKSKLLFTDAISGSLYSYDLK